MPIMSKIRLGLSLTYAAVFALGIVGCADESPWGNTSNEKGSIDISLTTIDDIATAKPVFRSGEDDANSTEDPNNLGSYISVPTAKDFSIKLEKADGSYSKTWNTLADFNSEASSSKFSTGSYTITAFYGVKGEQDFEKPYFEASSSLSVYSDQTTKVSLSAELKNSLVKINYTDGFRNYMKDYHTNLTTSGKTEEIVFNSAETRVAFIEPNEASLTVHFTTKDKNYTSSLNLGQFAPLAKTLHNITLDVKESGNGYSSLDVIFDDALTQETVKIDLTDELLTSQPPVITCVGFSDGETVDMLEGTASDVSLKMNVTAKYPIKSAVLTVEADDYTPGWGAEIDLCAATSDQQQMLRQAGIEAIGFYGITSEAAFLDITEFGKSLKNGIYTISLKVTDQNGVVSETSKLILNSLPITIGVVGEPSIVYGSGQVVLTMDYNGLNPETDITFQAWNSLGIYENVQLISCEDGSSRAFDTKRYIFTLRLPNTTKSMIMIKVLHNNKAIGEYEVPVTIPAYNISAVDAFSRYAHLQVETPQSDDPSTLAAVTNNIRLQDGSGKELNIVSRDSHTGVLTVGNLTPASSYSLKSTIAADGGWNQESLSIVTESELSIPNGDFSGLNGTVSSNGNLQVGGTYLVGAITYDPTSTFSYPLPDGWATINDKTAWTDAKNRNTWYVVPSSWVENGCGLMRNVGYNNNGNSDGKSLVRTGSFLSTTYYCTDTPDDLINAAGEIFLGSYSFNGTESRNEGIAFASRPSSISFDYEYNAVDGDHGYALIQICDAHGKAIAGKTLDLSGSKTETISLDYAKFADKAATLKVGFKSSNQSNPPIQIPSDLDEGTKLNVNAKIDANMYKAVATGSVLKIDNVKANYAASPASSNAPKRSVTKKR